MNIPDEQEPHIGGSVSLEEIRKIESDLSSNRIQIRLRAQIMAVTALAMTATSIVLTMTIWPSWAPNRTESVPTIHPVSSNIRQALDDVERRIEVLEKRGQDGGTSDAPISVTDGIQLLKEQGKLGKRLEALEGAIMASPETAISVPLLRRELESLRAEHDARDQFMRTDMDRIFAVGKWVMSGLVTLLGVIASWIVTVFVQNRRSGE